MTFETELFQMGNNTGIVVPEGVIDALGAGKKPPVVVVVNDSYTYRSTVAVMSNKYMISFSSEHRQKSGLRGGDPIKVDLTLDTEPRTVEMPLALAQALQKNTGAAARFEALSNSKKKAHALSVEGAKTEETRQRRVEKVISALKSD